MKISAAESVVMEALWRNSPLTSEAIMSEVCAPQDWTEGTVKVLISRLVKKKAVAAKADGRRYLYSPLLSRRDYVQGESQGLLDRLFDGRLAPLVMHFSDGDKLSDEDVAALKALVERIGK
ncbi:BlaI/MecI/CopY family transcriptional regulator [Caulobacter vibrioides]|uniref:Transcriptional regulator, BlaI family, putative n=2 Tax=Caulobacter vibrioides TaxID=155892 RepID=Q9A2P9_CAUVC|nr:BlaI/MecI/CopY family transcriptional regulator [Caulobacter vibrioides]YP_002518995.1 BlaI family transcriptional regulator [Caulobacter vibrioides NA1000]AAK25469.1 transcriptional regulator, BlaI family, putative [Caulobacter vibrioides CB15]ACL97087.1 BlaI family transcriptional regulator [Caulobacter vibrioides NA1000]ATC30322.1 BlaI family transcriptional regulator [Caulobacter vibrioides]QXZ51849.1 BlaI family transcriptional regulator [Caulobacter vibrioides]